MQGLARVLFAMSDAELRGVIHDLELGRVTFTATRRVLEALLRNVRMRLGIRENSVKEDRI